MKQNHDRPDMIPDEAIKQAFAGTDSVKFSARSFNYIKYRNIAFGDLGWWLPLTRVLPLIGITPQMLRQVFNPQYKVVERRKIVKRRFPFNLSWFGLNKNQNKVVGVEYETVDVELPENIENYDQLGKFLIADKPFQELAKVLGKSVEVWREDGGTGEYYHLFTAHPSGEIIEAVKS